MKNYTYNRSNYCVEHSTSPAGRYQVTKTTPSGAQSVRYFDLAWDYDYCEENEDYTPEQRGYMREARFRIANLFKN